MKACGTVSMYDHGCRCDACRAAKHAAYIARRDRLKLVPRPRVVTFPRPIKHGTEHAYKQHGCRCDRCRDAKRRARAARMLRIASA
jgi:hypothetical protein